MSTADEYRHTAQHLASYLGSAPATGGTFPGPEHYGKAYAALLWARVGEAHAKNSQAAPRGAGGRPPRDHGEFNAYALLACPGPRGGGRASPAGALRESPLGQLDAAAGGLPGAARPLALAPPGRLGGARGAHALWTRRPDLPIGRVCSRIPTTLSAARCSPTCGFSRGGPGRAARPCARRGISNPSSRRTEKPSPSAGAKGSLRIRGVALLARGGRGGDRGHEFRASAELVFGHLLRFRRADGSFPLVLQAGEPPIPGPRRRFLRGGRTIIGTVIMCPSWGYTF